MIRRTWSVGPVPTGPTRVRSAITLLLVALLVTGCRLDLTAGSSIEPDGSGTVSLSLGFDAELLDELDELEIDPTAELEAVAATDPAWEVVRTPDDAGGLEVTATRAVPDVAAIGAVFRELTAGLTDADPALLVDIEVVRDDDGGVDVAGDATFRPPASAGVAVDGTARGPAADQLAARIAASVDARLELGFPGRLVTHDGDLRSGRTVSWPLPVGETVTIEASAAPPAWWETLLADLGLPMPLVAGIGAAMLFAFAGLAVVLWRRRRTSAG